MIRVLVADDQPLALRGISAMLASASDIEIVGQVGNGRDAVATAIRQRPDVVVMDVRMPVMDGIAATAELTRTGPGGPRVLILTTFDLDEYVYDALAAGASGFLLKDTDARDLVSAVRVVAAGDALLAPTVTRRIIAHFTGRRPRRDVAGLATLTPRERAVLVLLAGGLSNTELAAALVIAEETVKTHVSRLLAKLGLRDRAQAIVFAYEAGLVNPGTTRHRR